MSLFSTSPRCESKPGEFLSCAPAHLRTCRRLELQVSFPAHSMFSFTKRGAEPMRKSIAQISRALCPRCVTVNPYGHSRVLWWNMSLRGKKKKVSKRVFSALAHGQKAAVWSRVVSKYSYLLWNEKLVRMKSEAGKRAARGRKSAC